MDLCQGCARNIRKWVWTQLQTWQADGFSSEMYLKANSLVTGRWGSIQNKRRNTGSTGKPQAKKCWADSKIYKTDKKLWVDGRSNLRASGRQHGGAAEARCWSLGGLEVAAALGLVIFTADRCSESSGVWAATAQEAQEIAAALGLEVAAAQKPTAAKELGPEPGAGVDQAADGVPGEKVDLNTDWKPEAWAWVSKKQGQIGY